MAFEPLLVNDRVEYEDREQRRFWMGTVESVEPNDHYGIRLDDGRALTLPRNAVSFKKRG